MRITYKLELAHTPKKKGRNTEPNETRKREELPNYKIISQEYPKPKIHKHRLEVTKSYYNKFLLPFLRAFIIFILLLNLSELQG